MSSRRGVPGHLRQPATERRTAGAVDGRRRVVVERVRPEIDGGRFPIKRTVGESVRVTAWIHADGHDVLAAVLRYRIAPPRRKGRMWLETPMRQLGNDEWAASFDIDEQGSYEYTVQAWVDGFESWRHSLGVKIDAGQGVSSELLEGAALVRAVAGSARRARAGDAARWLNTQADALEAPLDMFDRARTALDERLANMARRFPDRSRQTAYHRVLTVTVDRPRARFGAWYEMFPRSWGPDPTRSATFREAETHLHRIAAMGFDVAYLPPIHPIGTTFRKGRGNALSGEAGAPGSPWAIGSRAGGHMAVEPALGTLDDFDRFVGRARELGLEVALDLAFQCSPDHPYVREHPEWFRHRPDGTIKHAENPPKKYQDIYPFDFECDAWRSLWDELKSVVEFWTTRGIAIFRVDNPHMKPFAFWEWLIREVRSEHPDVIFLAEAFTRPKIMYYLAKVGFAQSYTYFTWRNTKDELAGYITEIASTDVAEYFRPNLFTNTPDILHAYLQLGGAPAFRIRLILAAMLGASYGIYSGFELCENTAVPGTEEYMDSEKYQYRDWDWDRPGHIRDLVTAVNRIRRENPALHANDGLVFCETDNPEIIAFTKISTDRSNAIFVVVNLDYEHPQHGRVRVPLDRLGRPQGDAYEVVDLLDSARYSWAGEWNYVRLDPQASVAHIFALPAAIPGAEPASSPELRAFLQHQRWFAGKTRTVQAAGLLDAADIRSAPDGVIPAIAEVRYADGGEERYFTPLAVVRDAVEQVDGTIVHAAGSTLVDALCDDAACRMLLGTLLGGGSMKMRRGVARATTYRPGTVGRRLPVRRSAAEQSNSCVRFGNRYVLKVLRRLERGPNPEVEISRFLTDRGFAAIPPLVASLEYEHPGEEAASLAFVQGFVANDGSGWDHAVNDARRFLQRESLPFHVEAVAFCSSAATLGQRTAELHRALASDDRDPVFAPAEIAPEDVAAFAASLSIDVGRSFSLLAESLQGLPEPARDWARAVLDTRGLVDARVSELATAPAGSLRTRVHGDYHLGQVLAVDSDFVILDFEGEPNRPLVERRAKQSPLKDVAGMVRSFSYAVNAALLSMPDDSRDPTGGLETRAHLWDETVAAAFVEHYRQATAGRNLVPAGDEAFDLWLRAFLLEKALYEVRYELASRPAWITIPLQGILRIAGAPRAQAGAR